MGRVSRSMCLLGLLALAGTARATTLDVTTTTVVQGRVQPLQGEEATTVPILQFLSLDARDIPNPTVDDLAFHFSAWGGSDATQGGARADLDHAFLSGTLFDRQIGFKLGRHYAQSGAARFTALDGGSGDFHVYDHAGFSVWGGLPVIPRFAVARGDALVGGRLYYRRSVDAEVGASYFQLWERGATARQEAGLDARYVISSLTLSGLGMWSVAESRLAEAELAATWQPLSQVEASVNIRRTAPDLFLSRTSILSVFASESRDEVGGSVSWRPLPALSLWVEYHFLRFGAESGDPALPLAGESAHEAVARTSYRTRWGLSVGVQGRLLDTPTSGYWGGRLFGSWRATDHLTAAMDLEVYRLAAPVNGRRESYLGSASLTYAVSPSWLVGASGLVSVTPFFERRFEGVVKVVYNFSTHQREVSP